MRFRMRAAVAIGAASVVALSGVTVATSANASAANTPDVAVHMTKSKIRLSSSTIHAGPTTFHPTSNDGKHHEMQVIRLHKGYSLQQAGADLQRSFQGKVKAIRRLDKNVSFRGGGPAARSGHPGSVTITLSKGHYYVLDQAGNGLASLTVRGSQYGRPAVPHTGVITAHTYGFSVGGHLPATGEVKMRNISDQPHFVAMTRVKNGTTRRQVARFVKSGARRNPPWILHAGTDSGVLSPYRHEVLHYRLPAGKYLVACFWPDDDTGMPHFFMGMWRLVNIG
jgi:hypothetical protein